MRSLPKKIKAAILAIVILLLVGTMVALFAARSHQQQSWRDTHPLSDSHVGFQMYIPTKLPAGIHITGKRIDIHHARFYNPETGDPNRLVSASVEMNLGKGDWVYGISESKTGTDSTGDTSTSLRNYDPTSKKPTFTQRRTPGGRSYRLCHWTDYGRISVFETKFNEAGTYIDTTFPTTPEKPISQSELDEYIDSFQPGDPAGLQMLVDTI